MNLRENYFQVSSLADLLRQSVQEKVPNARINGLSPDALPGIVNVTFPGTKNESLLVLLDRAGISASQGSACSAGVQRPSHVLLAMGLSEDEADATVRFSLGSTSTEADVQALSTVIADVVKKATL